MRDTLATRSRDGHNVKRLDLVDVDGLRFQLNDDYVLLVSELHELIAHTRGQRPDGWLLNLARAIDQRGRAFTRQIHELIEYCCWLYAVRGRIVELAMFLRTTGDLSEFGLQQLLRMADWNADDQGYLDRERGRGHMPLYWDVNATPQS